MLNAFLAGGVAAALLAAPAAAPVSAVEAGPAGPRVVATDDVPEIPVVIAAVDVLGSGCPPGTTAITFPDDAVVGLTYSDYLAQVGAGAPVTDFRKNCQISLDIQVPAGYTYAVREVSHRGTGDLAAGATAQVRTTYSFQGLPPEAPAPHLFAGPLGGAWEVVDATDLASLTYAPCGEQRKLRINTDVRVAAGTSDPATTPSLMAMESSVLYHLAWRRCA